MATELGPKGHIHAAAPTRPAHEAPGRTPPPTSRPDVSPPSRGGMSRRSFLGLVGAGGAAIVTGGLAITRPWEKSSATPTPPRRDGGGAAVTTPTTEAPGRSELDRQIGAFVRQAETGRDLSQETFLQWAADNPISQGTGGSEAVPWDFPADHDHTGLSVNNPNLPGGTGLRNYPNSADTRDINAEFDSSKYTLISPLVPSLAALYVDGEFNTWDFPDQTPPTNFYDFSTLGLHNGSLTVQLENIPGAAVDLSGIVQIWGDGKRTLPVWISFVDDPSDQRLQQFGTSFLGAQPMLGHNPSKDRLTTYSRTSIDEEQLTPDEYRAQLSDLVGEPIEVDFRGSGFLSRDSRGHELVGGQEYFTPEQFATHRALVDGQLYNNPEGFDLAVIAGVQKGLLLDPNDIEGSLQAIIDRVKSVRKIEDVFAEVPYGQVFTLPGATSPIPTS